MPIEGFDFKEFARTLSEQVGPVLPPEIEGADRQYIINIVFNFCYMAGEALYNDPNVNLDAQQASIVTQFIGEWAFHKSVDIIKSGIEPQYRDGILQKIAFTVFEIAKTAMIKNLPQADIIAVVEHHVKKAYAEALDELKNRGALTEEQVQNALNHSNIDDMAQAQAQIEQQQAQNQQNQQPPAQSNNTGVDYINNSSDTKLLKLATFSIVMKYLPQEKQKDLLSKFSQEDAAILNDYASMDDIESKLDKSLIIKCLAEIKKSLPEPKKLDISKINARLYNIVKDTDYSKVSNIIIRERQLVKDFVATATGKPARFVPPRIADIICTHIEEKLSQ